MKTSSTRKSKQAQIKIKPAHLVQALSIFALTAALMFQLLNSNRNAMLQTMRAELTQVSVNLQAALETELNAVLYLAEGLSATIQSMPDIRPDNLNKTIEVLYQNGKHLKNIGVSPGNRLTYIYPMEGNEAALGLHYPELPQQWPDVKKAINQKISVLAGPINLVQGGKGLINRTPVYLENGDYWGILSLVIDMESLFEATGISTPPEGIRLAIERDASIPSSRSLIWGDETILEGDPVLHKLNIPGHTWQIALVPENGWVISSNAQANLMALGFFISLLIPTAFLIFQTINYRLVSSQDNIQSILDTTRDSIIVLDDQGNIINANPASELVFGYSQDEIIGQPISMLVPADTNNFPERSQVKYLKEQKAHECHELTGRRFNGTRFPLEISMGETKVKSEGSYVWALRDISERKEVEAKLIKMATTDSLTGAMNRRSFVADGEKIFDVAKRYSRPISILSLDADHFKNINDTFGHKAGDQVLIAIVKALKDSLRKVDLVSRFGGEEFIVLLPETGERNAFSIAEKLRKAIAAEAVHTNENCIIKFTCSIGLATATEETGSLDELLVQADKALYSAKDAGRNQTQIYVKSKPNLDLFSSELMHKYS